MNDLISRKAAIDALGERPAVWIDDDEYSLGQRNQYDCDKLAIETVPSAQPDNDMIHLQKEQAYLQGWEEGREVLLNISAEKKRSALTRMISPTVKSLSGI